MKILIGGPLYYRYCQSVAAGFESCGYDATVLEWSTSGELSEPTSTLEKLTYHLYTTVAPKAYRSHHGGILHGRLLDLHRSHIFDVVLLIKPHCIQPDTLVALRVVNPKAKIVIWMMDSIRKCESLWKLLPYVDHLFLFEPDDLDVVRTAGFKQASFLPVAHDPSHYKPLHVQETDLALFFCGAFEGYGTRFATMQAVARYAADRNLRFEVLGAWWTKSRLDRYLRVRSIGNPLNRYIQNRRLTHDELNHKYNTACICLNAHNEQSVHGVNPRTFEITGAGGVMLTDYKSSLSELFNLEKDLLTYQSAGELIDKLDYLLGHEDARKGLRESANRTARSRHTFAHRAQTILAVLHAPTENLVAESDHCGARGVAPGSK